MANILDFQSDIRPFFGLSTCSEDDETFLMWLLRSVESQAKAYVGHGIIQQTVTGEIQRRSPVGGGECDAALIELVGDRLWYEEQPENDGHVLQLDNIFVRSITEVREDCSAAYGMGPGDFADTTLLTSGVDFYLELDRTGMSRSGRVIRRGRNWSGRPGTIKITYVAGLTQAELISDYAFVKEALLEDMQAKFITAKSQRTAGGGPVRRESWAGDYSVEYAVNGSTAMTWQLSPGARAKLEPIRRMLL